MNKKPYTISEVAKMLEVSPSTVSRAINNAPEVSENVRKKILDSHGVYRNNLQQRI